MFNISLLIEASACLIFEHTVFINLSIPINVDKCIAGEAKLVRDDLLSNLEDSMFYTVDGTLLSGRVEYCYNGSDYITVCSDHWDNTEASVLCNQLGFSPYGKYI